MADNMGPGSNGSAYYPPSSQQMPPQELMQQFQQFQQWLQQQQQPGGAQMGTRGTGDFQGQQPGGFQGQEEPQQGSGMTQPTGITPQEKVVLRGVLDILKQVRAALPTRGVDEQMDEMSDLRRTAARAYLAGFLEAKGQQEVGSYVSTIPPLSTRGIADNGEYDQMLDDLDVLVNPETRGPWGALAKAGWQAAKRVNWGGVARDVGINIGSSAIWDAVSSTWKR